MKKRNSSFNIVTKKLLMTILVSLIGNLQTYGQVAQVAQDKTDKNQESELIRSIKANYKAEVSEYDLKDLYQQEGKKKYDPTQANESGKKRRRGGLLLLLIAGGGALAGALLAGTSDPKQQIVLDPSNPIEKNRH